MRPEHVAIDGTKLQANAGKHKAMSYERMKEKEKALKAEVEKLLEEAARTDAEEDAKYGQGKRGGELPVELARRESRLKKIAEARAALEQETRERAVAAKLAVEARLEERRKQEQERGKKLGGRPPQVPDPEQAKPEPKAQRNFTDPDSRIMKDGASKSFLQGFNAQAAVDDTAQVIVGCATTQQVSDKRQLAPTIQQVEQNLGRKPEKAAADAGYFSAAAVTDPRVSGVKPWAPPDRQKHEATTEGAGEVIQEPAKLAEGPPSADVSTDPAPAQASVADAMRQEVAESGRAGGVEDAQGGGGTGVRAEQGAPGIPALSIPRFEKGRGGAANYLPDARPVEAVPGGSVPARGLEEAQRANNRLENGVFGPARRQKVICLTDQDTLHRKVVHNPSYAGTLCAFS